MKKTHVAVLALVAAAIVGVVIQLVVARPGAESHVVGDDSPRPQAKRSVDGAEKPLRVRQVPESIRKARPQLAHFLDPFAKNRCPEDFSEIIPFLGSQEEIDQVVALLYDANDGDTPRNEAINLLRRSNYPGLEKDLIALSKDRSERPRFRAFCVQHLGVSLEGAEKAPRKIRDWSPLYVRDTLVDFVKDETGEVRREALHALVKVRDARATDVVFRELGNPGWSQDRDLLIRCAVDLSMASKAPEIRPLAYSEDVDVRVAALNALAHWRDEVSRPAMEEAANSPVARIKNAGEVALFQMSKPVGEGGQQPSDHGASGAPK